MSTPQHPCHPADNTVELEPETFWFLMQPLKPLHYSLLTTLTEESIIIRTDSNITDKIVGKIINV